jgi:hypothetical protein
MITVSGNCIKAILKVNTFITGLTIKFAENVQGKVILVVFNTKYEFDIKSQR